MREHLAEVDASAHEKAEPTFENTVQAFDRCGRTLQRIDLVFHNLTSSETSPELQAVQRTMAPKLAAHDSAIRLHEGLFRRIAALHERREQLGLDDEDLRLLERTHQDFVLAGARLTGDARQR